MEDETEKLTIGLFDTVHKRLRGRPVAHPSGKPRTVRQRARDGRERKHQAMTAAIGNESEATDLALVDLLTWVLKMQRKDKSDPATVFKRVLQELNKRCSQTEN